MNLKELLGELIGTGILVFFGCGAIIITVLFGALDSLLEVALIWGFGVTIAIFATKNLSPAHLNPAVSIAMTLAKKSPLKKLPVHIMGQFIGAFLAAALLYGIFSEAIHTFEMENNIVRGEANSTQTAQFFGEFYPNPGFSNIVISPLKAMFMEGLGTFILVFVIFRLTEKSKEITPMTPVLIGLTVTLIICIVAPFTQAGLNPARDFGPRLFASLAGWGNAAFPSQTFSFFYVYILGPVLGGAIAALLQKILINRSA